MKYKLLDKDYTNIFEHAVRLFHERAAKPNYEHFMSKCFVDSMISFLQAKKLDIIKGEVYERNESQSEEK